MIRIYGIEYPVTFYENTTFERYVVTFDNEVEEGRVKAFEWKHLHEYLPQFIHLTALPKYYRSIEYKSLSKDHRRKLCLILFQMGYEAPLAHFNKSNKIETATLSAA